MHSNNYKSVLKHARLAASVLLLASGTAFAQQQVSLTAAPATATMPDGTAVPMWGYTCGTLPTGDRKSTRLNSSHSQISYAVFCLKKKKSHSGGLRAAVVGVSRPRRSA